MSEVMTMEQAPSSINAAWPPVAASDNRLRGFYTEGVIRSESEARGITDEFNAYREAAESAGHDRLSIRAVTSLGGLALLGRTGVQIEGALPFERDGEDLALAYLGWNNPSRSVPGEAYSRYRQLLSGVVQYPRRSTDPGAALEQRGYTPQLLDGEVSDEQRTELAADFADLYAAFGYGQAEVEALLRNPGNTIGYIEHDGQIISTAMAESGSIDIKDFGPVHMVEMTEAFTRPEYRGRGLYKDISGFVLNIVMNERREGQRDVDVLYGESNLAMPGVLYSARENGRRFNHFDTARLGVGGYGFGILPQNVEVRDGVNTRPYNDFALTYVDLSEEATR